MVPVQRLKARVKAEASAKPSRRFSRGSARRRRAKSRKYSSHRRDLIGSGGREEKIRTYNFPQNRLTDHRIGLTLYNLDAVIGGQLDEVIEKLQASEMEDRLREAGME